MMSDSGLVAEILNLDRYGQIILQIVPTSLQIYKKICMIISFTLCQAPEGTASAQ